MVAILHSGVAPWHAGPVDIVASRTPSATLRAQSYADLQRLASRYSCFDSARFPALALTLSVHLPTVRREDRALAGLVALWIIAFDALVDEGETDVATLGDLVTHFGSLASLGREAVSAISSSSNTVAQLDSALREIDARVTACQPSPALRAWWAATFRAAVVAIVRQRELGVRRGPAPGYTALLPLLLDSIGVRPYLVAGAIVGRERGLAARLPSLADLASDCALVIRLANDLRTWKKDEAEGQVNTLVGLRGDLLRADPAQPYAVAHERALAMLAERRAFSLARCRVRLAASTHSGETEAGMVRLASVVAGIYATHDYHTYRIRDERP